jgi:hypothetical protein
VAGRMTQLADWQTFYIVVGPSAGALIGLQFILITLIAERPPPRAGEANAAFATPTIFHLAVVLSLAAIPCAPWPSLAPAAFLACLVGVGGASYVVVVARRMRRQQAYRPVASDWFYHAVLPLLAYLTLVAAGALATRHDEGLYGTAAAALGLLLVGIHNAWDAVAYVAARRASGPDEAEPVEVDRAV